jgi:hypothetical protein
MRPPGLSRRGAHWYAPSDPPRPHSKHAQPCCKRRAARPRSIARTRFCPGRIGLPLAELDAQAGPKEPAVLDCIECGPAEVVLTSSGRGLVFCRPRAMGMPLTERDLALYPPRCVESALHWDAVQRRSHARGRGRMCFPVRTRTYGRAPWLFAPPNDSPGAPRRSHHEARRLPLVRPEGLGFVRSRLPVVIDRTRRPISDF